MNKQKIDPWDYAGVIARAMRPGILLTTCASGKVNSMAIGWGTMGVVWERPVFVAYVRDNRFTHNLLSENPEFTVNVPMGGFDRHILGICGSKSGRDMDKIAAAGLTLVEPEVISVPGIKELPLTLECRQLFRQQQVPDSMDNLVRQQFYKVDSHEHTAFYGEIVASYIIGE